MPLINSATPRVTLWQSTSSHLPLPAASSDHRRAHLGSSINFASDLLTGAVLETLKSIPTMTTKPAIVLCVGSFHVPAHYNLLIAVLRKRGFTVICPRLPTMMVSEACPDNADDPAFDALPTDGTWPDGVSDAEVIREEIDGLVSKGLDVLLLGHSYGAWVATEAAESKLLRSTRTNKGATGGIIGMFYIAGYILPQGQSIHEFFSPQGDATPLPPFVTLHVSNKSQRRIR